MLDTTKGAKENYCNITLIYPTATYQAIKKKLQRLKKKQGEQAAIRQSGSPKSSGTSLHSGINSYDDLYIEYYGRKTLPSDCINRKSDRYAIVLLS